MKKEIKRKRYGFLFSCVFLIKMLISAAPIIYAHLCSRQHAAAVIMQLELENNEAKSNYDDLSSEKLAKEFPVFLHWNIITPLRYLSVNNFIADEMVHMRSFYPTVPTPPPNC